METTVKLYSLNFRQAKTYWFTLLFVAGNLILPQLCHLIPQGGLILLPIYFFTLIAAYKFGIRVGLLTAVLSPLANSALFGMPAAAVLPEILIKSVTLAVAAAMAARYLKNVSMLAMVAVVLALTRSSARCSNGSSRAASLPPCRISVSAFRACCCRS